MYCCYKYYLVPSQIKFNSVEKTPNNLFMIYSSNKTYSDIELRKNNIFLLSGK